MPDYANQSTCRLTPAGYPSPWLEARGIPPVLLNDGSGRSWQEQWVGEEVESTYGVKTADLNGDGYPEIGFANSGAPNRFFTNVGRR